MKIKFRYKLALIALGFISLWLLAGCANRPPRRILRNRDVAPVQTRSTIAPVKSAAKPKVLFELPEYQSESDSLSEPM